MVKFIHCADVHLGRSIHIEAGMPSSMKETVLTATYISFKNIIDKAIEEKVDFLIISGDLYDHEHRSLRGQWFVKKQVERLNEHHIRVFIIHGNHDPIVEKQSFIHLPNNVHVFSSEGEQVKVVTSGDERVCIHGFSYPEKAYTDNPTCLYEDAVENQGYHIGVLHGQEKTNQEHEPYAPFALRDLLQKGYHYWALGHIHERKVLSTHPPVIYSGNVQGAHRKEKGPKGAYLVQFNGNEVETEFFETAPLIWVEQNVSIDDVDTIDALVQDMIDELPQKEGDTTFLIDLKIIGEGPLHLYLKKEEHRDELLTLLREEVDEHCWVHRLEVLTSPVIDRDSIRKQEHLLGDIVRISEQEKQDFQAFDDTISKLQTNRLMKKYIEPFSEDEKVQIIDSAEKMLLSSLMEEEEEQ
ncbi:DNA repair exonuclease [Bacillus shivajii]|uniref:metallophosphoesterase family protein n=1 Tax=Bacillus shivajii TaxID=1983719 RepID=UPI001CFBD6F7|nr:DNA repair exonuclease [Bacillus shivajii]UCZ54310.1 DNA repair exonuclease [Bacillus shivajii]